MVAVRRTLVILATGTLGFTGIALAQSPTDAGDPPGRVGRLAYLQGAVSFHDNDQADWQPALLNTPITTGDALWTEPNAHGEITIAGTRVRLDSATQLEMVALDDTLTRLQLDQGRVDIKTFEYDARQPYEVVTPRGIVTLQQQGDYYVEAGSTQDPTRLGVRQGAAQLQTPNGQTLAVRAGEVAEITGDGSAPQLRTIKAAPPPTPAYWAERDRQIAYDRPPQYLSASVTGYEDLNRYGTWRNDPQYGQVWYVNSPPAGWAPYTTGRWVSDPRYGWTWVDEQPWGFAPYHYGRWAQRNNHWFWVPPDRQQRAVYAPALVGFLGGIELGTLIGQQNRRPVGWFPLGPREVYVPPYAMNRDYYRRINLSARIQDNILEDRWQRFQRREAIQDERAWMNRRYARIVAADDFARSRPVERSLIRVPADRLATAPVAAIAAPPRPNESIRALLTDRRDNDRPNEAKRPDDRRPDDRRADDRRPDARPDRDRADAMLGIRPEPEKAKAPGPQIAKRADANHAEGGANDSDRKDSGKPALPQLAPHNASAPPQPKLDGDRQPADGQPGQAKGNAPDDKPDRDRADPHPGKPNLPGQANLPPVRDRNDKRPEPPRADDRQPGQPNQAAEPKRPDNASRPDADDKRPGQAQRPDGDTKGQAPVQRPAENRPPQPQPQPNQAAEPKRPDADDKRPGQAQRPDDDARRAAPVQRPAENRPPPPHQPQPNQAAEPKRAEPPRPPENRPAPPQQAQQPQRQPEAPKPPQAQPAPRPQPQAPAPQQQQQQRPDRQGMNAPQPQHQPAPQPQRQATPQPQQHQAAPQPQRQAAPQPQPQRQAPPQASHPPQQAQTPGPQPRKQDQ